MIETKYTLDDTVYVINEYKIIKSVVSSIVLTKDKRGEHITYNVYPYCERDKEKKHIRPIIEACLVATLDEARQSALANWRRITLQVEKDLNNLTDEAFEANKDDSK